MLAADTRTLAVEQRTVEAAVGPLALLETQWQAAVPGDRAPAVAA